MSQGAPVPAVHALPDGRRLTWYEFGDPAGRPVIHTAGTPESGLAGACYHEAAHQAGLRWISPDKPGYGGSDFQPGRRLLDWAGDVASLADHLGLGQFSVAGESGGGPSTLALAHQLGERIRVVALLAAMGPPGDARSRVGMRRGIRAMFWLARHAPALLVVPLTAMSRTLPGPARRGRHPRRGQAEPATDALAGQHPELRGRIDAAIDAFRQGPRGGGGG
ncbi:MAG: alpha/beta fold hydrolase, partial [Streptosporangiaceae bacterium]